MEKRYFSHGLKLKFRNRPLPVESPEKQVADALIAFAVQFAQGSAVEKPLSALLPPVLNFQTRSPRESTMANSTVVTEMPQLDMEKLRSEIELAMENHEKNPALADPAVARKVVRLFWMMGLNHEAALPDGDLLFPDIASLEMTFNKTDARRNPTLYVLATQAESQEITEFAKHNGRNIVPLIGEKAFVTKGNVNFSLVEEALGQLEESGLDNLHFVLTGAQIDSLMPLLANKENVFLRKIRYVAREILLNMTLPLTATNLIEMNITAEMLVRQNA